jgi:hypothetical protein
VRNTGYKSGNKDIFRLWINENVGRYFIINNNNMITVKEPTDSSGIPISKYTGKLVCIDRPQNLAPNPSPKPSPNPSPKPAPKPAPKPSPNPSPKPAPK